MEPIVVYDRDFNVAVETLTKKLGSIKTPVRAQHMFCSDTECQKHVLAIGCLILRCECGASVVEPKQ